MEAIATPATASNPAMGATAGPPPIPFDAARLDALMDEAGIDALVVTSKHNIQYLLGGYRFFFFDHFDAIGVSRYLPVLVYVKGASGARGLYRTSDGKLRTRAQPVLGPDLQRLRSHGHRRDRDRNRKARGACAESQKDRRRARFPARRRRRARFARECPGCEFIEAQLPLERLRAVKTPQELEYLRMASDLVVDSMLAVMAGAQARRDQA